VIWRVITGSIVAAAWLFYLGLCEIHTAIPCEEWQREYEAQQRAIDETPLNWPDVMADDEEMVA
jgi:hypothetical protein